LGLTNDEVHELVFYDAAKVNDGAFAMLGDLTLELIERELVAGCATQGADRLDAEGIGARRNSGFGEAHPPQVRLPARQAGEGDRHRASAGGAAVQGLGGRESVLMEKHTEEHTGPEILLVAEFSGMLDAWPEHLCIEKNADGTITLSSRSHPVLAEVGKFMDDEGEVHLPEAIDGVRVGGYEGDYVVGEDLVPHGDEAEITLSVGQEQEAEAWLRDHGWEKKGGYDEAWRRIQWALAGNRTPPPPERKPRARKPSRRRPTA
jgi:hypothetical protein